MKKILYTSPDEIHYTKMDDDVREEKKYLVCADSSMSGNYTLFFYGDGYLTAYMMMPRLNIILPEKFLKQNF
jgi:hypothetical protein